jgi:hypothetical protein
VAVLGRPRQAARRARAEVAVASVLDKRLGALPVVAGFVRRLDLAGIIDRACPVRQVAYATHGQIIEVLVANRLTSPAPLLHVSRWAEQWAVEEVFGLPADVLGDDRLPVRWTRSLRNSTTSSGRWVRWRSPSSVWTWPGSIGT